MENHEPDRKQKHRTKKYLSQRQKP
jgi:hypothetical protein